MPFQPGNKHGKGRPPVGMSLANAVRAKYPPDEIVKRAARFLDTDDQRVAFSALQFLATYGYGKPKEAIEMKSDLTEAEIAEELAIIAREYIAALSDEERAEMLRETGIPDDMGINGLSQVPEPRG